MSADHDLSPLIVAVDVMTVVSGAPLESGAGRIGFDTVGEFVYEMDVTAEFVRSMVDRRLGIARLKVLNEDPGHHVDDPELDAGLRRALGVEAIGFLGQARETARFMAVAPDDRGLFT